MLSPTRSTARTTRNRDLACEPPIAEVQCNRHCLLDLHEVDKPLLTDSVSAKRVRSEASNPITLLLVQAYLWLTGGKSQRIPERIRCEAESFVSLYENNRIPVISEASSDVVCTPPSASAARDTPPRGTPEAVCAKPHPKDIWGERPLASCMGEPASTAASTADPDTYHPQGASAFATIHPKAHDQSARKGRSMPGMRAVTTPF
jgi:hypothetical protein